MTHFKHQSAQILTPKDGQTIPALRNVVAGSAIAAVPAYDEETTAIYYEGNTNGSDNLDIMFERIYCAAGRAITGYPTIAKTFIKTSELERFFNIVGEVKVIEKRMSILLTDAEKLDSWADQYIKK